jgi:hypothetical protein
LAERQEIYFALHYDQHQKGIIRPEEESSMICPIMSPGIGSKGKPDYLECRKDCAWFAGSLEPEEIGKEPDRGTCLLWGIFDRLNEIALNLEE